MNREENVAIFEDTRKTCKTNCFIKIMSVVRL